MLYRYCTTKQMQMLERKMEVASFTAAPVLAFTLELARSGRWRFCCFSLATDRVGGAGSGVVVHGDEGESRTQVWLAVQCVVGFPTITTGPALSSGPPVGRGNDEATGSR